jgi:hypothetical protein
MMKLRLVLQLVSGLTIAPSVIYGGSFELFLNGVRSEYAAQQYPRLSDLKELLPANMPVDGLIWIRSSHLSSQVAPYEQCLEKAEALTWSLYPRDLLVSERQSVKESIRALLLKSQPTGRILEYGSLDPGDLDANDFLDRRIRGGDQFILDLRLELIWTWDYLMGWREQPHRPTNTAHSYALESIASGAARGDWAYQVSPSGKVTLVGLAGFNRSSDPVPNGSILFFPPPGLGRGNQPAYECIASMLAVQVPTFLDARKWWSR